MMADKTLTIRDGYDTYALYKVPLIDNGDGTYSPLVKLGTTPTIDIGDVTLLAGTALVGKFGIDQATANANEVVIKTMAALVAGTANVGKVDPNTATPTVYNVTCTVADTEYSQALPANCRYFEFQARTEAILRFAFATGKVATPTAPYMTLKAGDYYCSPPISQGASPSTLYFASPTAGTVLSMIAWT